MKYHDWITFSDETKRDEPDTRGFGVDRMYQYNVAMLHKNHGNAPVVQLHKMRLKAESAWEKIGRPYYKVHPKLVSQLSRTNLDKIPGEYIEVPFGVVCVRFADATPPIPWSNESQAWWSALKPRHKDEAGAWSVLLSRALVPGDDDTHVLMSVDIGLRGYKQHTGITHILNLPFSFTAGESVGEGIRRCVNEVKGDSVKKSHLIDLGQRLMRLVVTVGFLANQNEEDLISPDVLNADEDKLKKAIAAGDKQAIERLIDRAKRRRGTVGWNVGTNEMFVDNHAVGSGHRSEPTGKELRWQHIRTGHPHPVRYGPGRRAVKIKWFRTTRVRPDLPFNPD